jgi:hypothetical protein
MTRYGGSVVKEFLRGVFIFVVVALGIYGRIKWSFYREEQSPEWPRGLGRKSRIQRLFGDKDSQQWPPRFEVKVEKP